MDFLNIVYKYRNKFLNSDDLINMLDKLDLSQFTKNDKITIQKIILDIKKLKENTPNEIDDEEIKRKEQIDKYLEVLDKIKENENNKKNQEYIQKHYKSLLRDKNYQRDCVELYTSIINLLYESKLIKKYFDNMSDKELLDFITHYISVPFPPQLTQKQFNNLCDVGILEDKREALWRLAFNYQNKQFDMKKIVSYFIEKRDSYYLIELISAVRDDLNMEELFNESLMTKDKVFIKDCANRSLNLDLFTKEEFANLKEQFRKYL